MFSDVRILGMGLYEIFLTIGLLVVIFSADRMGIKRGFSVGLQRMLIITALLAVLCGLFGAMFFQAVYDWIATGVFDLFGSGMTFYGGFIFGVVFFLLIWFFGSKPFKLDKEAKERFPDVADIAACMVPLAHAFGRLGCFSAGCCHGQVTDAWYGIVMNGQKVVPIQLFESIFLFALAGIMLWLYFSRKGEKRFPLIPVYGVAYGIWRFFIEFARGDDRGATVVSFLSPSQLIAIVLIVIGVAYFCLWYFLKKKKAFAAVPAAVAENGEIEQTEENESVEVSKENNFELENINRKSKND